MSEKCYTMKDGTFIPMCMGAAARGKDYCTCKTMTKADLQEQIADNHKRAEEIIAARERQIERLREEVKEEHERYIESCKNTAIQKSVRHKLEQELADLRRDRERLTKQQAVVVSAYTGFVACDFPDLHRAIEEKLGRPVFTHELASKEVWDEIRNAFKADFLAICQTDAAIRHSQTENGEGEG